VDALSYNVAALLRAAPGTENRYPVENVRLDVADDLTLAEPINGEVRLSRMGRSVLARAHLSTSVEGLCARCLTTVVRQRAQRPSTEVLRRARASTLRPVRDRRTSPLMGSARIRSSATSSRTFSTGYLFSVPGAALSSAATL